MDERAEYDAMARVKALDARDLASCSWKRGEPVGVRCWCARVGRWLTVASPLDASPIRPL